MNKLGKAFPKKYPNKMIGIEEEYLNLVNNKKLKYPKC